MGARPGAVAGEVLARIACRRITPSATVSARGKVKQWQCARKLDVITYDAAISACEKGKQRRRALELSEEIRSPGAPGRRDHVRRRHQRLREGQAPAACPGATGGDASAGAPGQRDRVQRRHQRLREGQAAAPLPGAIGGDALAGSPDQRDQQANAITYHAAIRPPKRRRLSTRNSRGTQTYGDRDGGATDR